MAADIELDVRRARRERTPSASRGRRTIHRPGGMGMGWFLLPAALILIVFSVYPLVTLIRMAFSDVGPTNLLGGWHWVGFHNFGPVLSSTEFWGSLKTTVYFTAGVAVVDLVVGFFFATWLSYRTADAKFVQALMVFVWALPSAVVGNIWRFLFADNGFVNKMLGGLSIGPVNWLGSAQLSIWTVSLIACWASLPLSVVMFRAALLNIPTELLDAAAVDGATAWQTKVRIVLPLLRPTFLILTILNLMYGFRSFDYIYVITHGGPGTATATLPYLSYRDAFIKFDFSRGAVEAILSMIIVAALGFAYLQASRKEA
ncbi:MAG TPA: sugar ABC transporter permease [Mycobacteriales bacterium]|nr:sugar ABC transporter permease [Mycobacteriales bacterium]